MKYFISNVMVCLTIFSLVLCADILTQGAATTQTNVSLVKKQPVLASIDSILIMQKSQEGQKIAKEIQKDVESFQSEVKKSQKELEDMQTDISSKAKILNQEALQEKTEKLAQKKKDIERKLMDKEEAIKINIQKKQITLREKQLAIANSVSEKEGWDIMIDKNAPGVLFVAKAVDKTDLVLRAVDEKYIETQKGTSLAQSKKSVSKETIKSS